MRTHVHSAYQDCQHRLQQLPAQDNAEAAVRCSVKGSSPSSLWWLARVGYFQAVFLGLCTYTNISISIYAQCPVAGHRSWATPLSTFGEYSGIRLAVLKSHHAVCHRLPLTLLQVVSGLLHSAISFPPVLTVARTQDNLPHASLLPPVAVIGPGAKPLQIHLQPTTTQHPFILMQRKLSKFHDPTCGAVCFRYVPDAQSSSHSLYHLLAWRYQNT